MAVDTTPPRSKLIFIAAGICVATLIVLKFILDSYFVVETEKEVAEKVLTRAPVEIDALRKQQEALLRGGAMPIDRAIAAIAKQGRKADESIEARPSDDTGALVGWAELPNEVEEPKAKEIAASNKPSADTTPAENAAALPDKTVEGEKKGEGESAAEAGKGAAKKER